MEMREPVIANDMKAAFKEAGVKKAQAIMVHTSLSSPGYVCGGAQLVFEALLESVGEEDTIMMPTNTMGLYRESSAIRVCGQRVWKDYETLAADGEDLLVTGEACELTGQVRHLSLGNGILSMMSQRALVDCAEEWIGEKQK